eukprot:687487-Prorocentrum_minimum.AAC.1
MERFASLSCFLKAASCAASAEYSSSFKLLQLLLCLRRLPRSGRTIKALSRRRRGDPTRAARRWTVYTRSAHAIGSQSSEYSPSPRATGGTYPPTARARWQPHGGPPP